MRKFKYTETEGILVQEYIVTEKEDPRAWLAENIKGLGYKEASHFLRNIGYGDSAIIHFHIVDILVDPLIDVINFLGLVCRVQVNCATVAPTRKVFHFSRHHAHNLGRFVVDHRLGPFVKQDWHRLLIIQARQLVDFLGKAFAIDGIRGAFRKLGPSTVHGLGTVGSKLPKVGSTDILFGGAIGKQHVDGNGLFQSKHGPCQEDTMAPCEDGMKLR